jgi:hypothetical protein
VVSEPLLLLADCCPWAGHSCGGALTCAMVLGGRRCLAHRVKFMSSQRSGWKCSWKCIGVGQAAGVEPESQSEIWRRHALQHKSDVAGCFTTSNHYWALSTFFAFLTCALQVHASRTHRSSMHSSWQATHTGPVPFWCLTTQPSLINHCIRSVWTSFSVLSYQ